MPVFVPLFIGAAVVSAMSGTGMFVKGVSDHGKAKKLNDDSKTRSELAASRLEELRKQCNNAMEELGREKLVILEGNIGRFLDAFTRLKNVEFSETEGLFEAKRFHAKQADFDELKKMNGFASSMLQGGVTGVAGGALTAFGAYSAASALATASTGTAISTLSGVAASNATLAFFGGGSLAAGGMGIAGGMAVLGGLVTGPALLVMGMIVGAKAGKNLENAKAYAAQTDQYCEEMEAGAEQCIAIRRRTYMLYVLLTRLDAYFLPLIRRMEDIIATEGEDYSVYSDESKGVIGTVVSTAISIKTVVDTPMLAEDGSLTEESKDLLERMKE